ncbi:hypothetical protein SOVF_154040 [Spinacia oleracea]|uniref:Double-stranded RNA-binding protein 1 isoform X2 n=1 Tax=Spinacia oleracea TaxID=3562 RepID=A0A9R0IR45_SPIOL|nr:double-stranded RNA-binding protein 1-like isoform X2 [Spinacia oleracea]KNA09382.1 hypothetical protein SOVF_154040 [Spinacia oleracea]
MEATQVNASNGFEDGVESVGLSDQLTEVPAGVGPTAEMKFDLCTDVSTSFENKKQSIPRDQHSQDSSMHLGISCDPRVQVSASDSGVSNCYVFKSQLQEYAQKVGFPTPVYETIKDGPSHEPSFKSTVVVNGARYESLPGFFNRKAAEQSAAEIALMDLSKSGDTKHSIAVPVHETGLCKNLLQEYAQKMNYAIPTYICHKDDDTPGKKSSFYCTVEIGGIKYIGASARNKKEAEIKVARTALLAIRSSRTVESQDIDGKPKYTVVPGKRKMPEKGETDKVKKKPKKFRFKKSKLNQTGIMGVLVSNDVSTPLVLQHALSNAQIPNHEQNPQFFPSSDQDIEFMNNNQLNRKSSVVKDVSVPEVDVVDCSHNQVTVSGSQVDDHGNTCSAQSAIRNHDVSDVIPVTEAPPSVQSYEENNDQGVSEVIPVINAPFSGQLDALPANVEVSQDDRATAVADTENNSCTNVPSD